MQARFNALVRAVLLGFLLGGIVVSYGSAALAEQPAPGKFFTANTLSFPDGTVLEEGVISGPPSPPPGFEAERQAVSLPAPDSAAGTKTLTVPAFNWVFGCSAVSGAMIAGYYDRNGYPNMYTGPTGGGVMPLDNSSWPTWSDGTDTYPNCPLIASKNGVDGRTTKGSIDDYWVQYGSSASDPYITGSWTQHDWSDAIGDYMKTSQSVHSNTDGSTVFYNYTSGSDRLTCDAMVSHAIHTRDGTYGRKLFYEARGYTVTDCYNQRTDNKVSGGFSFDQFKTEIDAGRPVFLNLAGHSIVGVGYDDAGQTVYIHDTWDYNNHTMTWGGSYAGMELLSVSIVNLASPVSAVSLTPSLTSPRTVGTGITFTAASSGGSGSAEYQFWVRTPGGTWSIAQAYDSDTTWAWDTTGLSAGTYTIQVWARNSGSTAGYEAYKSISYVLAPPPASSVTLAPDKSSPRPVGTGITFTAAAAGGSGTYQYQFWVRTPGGTWSIAQTYGSASTFAWDTTGLSAGTYTVQVWARSNGSTASYEAYKSISYVLSPPPATSVTLAPDKSSPRPVGTAITFTAAAAGGTGTYEYQFWVRTPGGAWTVAQAYSSAATWDWTTTGLSTGTYTIQVWARNAGSTASYEAYRSLGYSLSAAP